MPSDPRWTAETEVLLARTYAAYDVGYVAALLDDQYAEFQSSYLTNARNGLAALADAGLLLPSGGEQSQEREGHYDEFTGRTCFRCGYVEDGSHRRTVTTFPDGSVLTGPWTPVDALDVQQNGEET